MGGLLGVAIAQLGTNAQSGVPLPGHWGWLVVLYFFFGGLAAGSYFIAAILDAVDDPRDRDAVRLGYLIAFPLVLLCVPLLVLDLGKPLRFWHMLVMSERFPMPILKPWSPISVGSWVLLAFGFFSFVSFVGALVESRRIRWTPLVRVDRWMRARPRPLALLWAAVGAFFGFFLAGYTGVLLVSSTSPAWHNARLLGAVFLASAASTSYALLILLLLRRRVWRYESTIRKLAAADRWAIGIELGLLLVMLVLLGRVARPFVWGGYGLLFWVLVVGVGLVVPLLLHRGHRAPAEARRRQMIAAACALVGGLVLRLVIVMAPQWPEVKPWHL